MTLVVGSHLRWDGVWQRPQQLLSRLARRVPVIFVEEPFFADEERDEIFRDGAITIVRPLRCHPEPFDSAARSAATLRTGSARRARSRRVDGRTIETVRRLLDGATPLVWLYQPMMLDLADAFARLPLVYDCMDDLAAFAFAPPGLREREAELLRRADLVFCGGRTLYEQRRGFGAKVRSYPSGVEYERFAAARDLPPHAVVAALNAPRFGYLGVVDERVDVGLIEALAADARASVVMVGPLAKIDPALLPRSPNVHFTGMLPYPMLPAILAGLEVALMPFAQNESTRSISPTKTLEYLAAGVPVVSTPIDDVVVDYGDVVTIAEGKDFVRACALSATTPNKDKIDRGQARARTQRWDAIAERMWEELEPLLSR